MCWVKKNDSKKNGIIYQLLTIYCKKLVIKCDLFGNKKKGTQIKIGKQIIITINSRESIIKHGVWRDQIINDTNRRAPHC